MAQQKQPPLAGSLRSIFDADITAGFIDDFICMLREVYPDSHDRALDAGYGPAQMRDHLAQFRRGLVEARLPGLAERHGLACEPRENASRNTHNVILTDRIAITASYVREAWGYVRRAKFRNAYAGANLWLFEADQRAAAAAAADANRAFGILLHAADPERPSELGFVGVGFPAARGYRYAEKIDLTRRLTLARRRERKVEDVPVVPIRTKPGKGRRTKTEGGTS